MSRFYKRVHWGSVLRLMFSNTVVNDLEKEVDFKTMAVVDNSGFFK